MYVRILVPPKQRDGVAERADESLFVPRFPCKCCGKICPPGFAGMGAACRVQDDKRGKRESAVCVWGAMSHDAVLSCIVLYTGRNVA